MKTVLMVLIVCVGCTTTASAEWLENEVYKHVIYPCYRVIAQNRIHPDRLREMGMTLNEAVEQMLVLTHESRNGMVEVFRPMVQHATREERLGFYPIAKRMCVEGADEMSQLLEGR